VSDSRAFDDDRWPDQEGFAVCFLCGRRVDPRDPNRGTYTPNAKACESLVAHVTPCLQDAVADPDRLMALAMTALSQMSDLALKGAQRAARVVVPSRAG
jgi:hypothetical protein